MPVTAAEQRERVGAVEQAIQQPLGQHRVREERIEVGRLAVGGQINEPRRWRRLTSP